MSWNNYEFKCPECGGSGRMVCGCCGSENYCESCEGCGLDCEQVDIPRLREAERNLPVRPDNSGRYELIENDVWVGRTNGVEEVYYRDFLKA